MNQEPITAQRLERAFADVAATCEHCDDTGKILVYGIDESWEEPCPHCNAYATQTGGAA